MKMKSKDKIKSSKGITLIALVITIIVLLILAGVSIALLTGDNGIITRANSAEIENRGATVDEEIKLWKADKTLYEKTDKKGKAPESESDILNRLLSQKLLTENEKKELEDNRKVQIGSKIIELEEKIPTPPVESGAWNGKVNTPKMSKGMIPIKHNGTNWVVCSQDDSDWFEYIDQASGKDLTSKWANIMLSDGTYKEGTVQIGQVVQENELGSMYVWIPRYAYVITSNYHTNLTTGGVIKVAFLEGTKEYKVGDTINYTYQGNSESSKIVNVSGQGNLNEHPAFNYGGTIISGIWMSKFEASSSTPNVANGGGDVGNLKIKSLPNVPSWRMITVSNIYTNCINMNDTTNATFYGIEEDDTKIDPHMMKNSEWGAVAYLTQSSYGRNGNEIFINNNQNCITGISSGSTNVGLSTSVENSYTTEIGQKASTTGNMSGIYDMSGGAWEYVAGYVNNGNSNLQIYGNSLVNSLKLEHKDLYAKGTIDDKLNYYNEMASKYGDALYETSNNYNVKDGSWFGDYFDGPDLSKVFLLRGGNYSHNSSAGIFHTYGIRGQANATCSFRAVIITK